MPLPHTWRTKRIPAWAKITYATALLVIVPIYAFEHGLANFLWFSNVALILAAVATVLEHKKLASMIAVGVLIPELAWNFDLFIALVTGSHPLGLTRYMFQADIPLIARLLSLYHVILPPLLIYLLYQLGYHHHAWRTQIILGWAVLLATYTLTDPQANINWAFGPGEEPQTFTHPLAWLAIILIAYPLLIVLPTHAILRLIFKTPPQPCAQNQPHDP